MRSDEEFAGVRIQINQNNKNTQNIRGISRMNKKINKKITREQIERKQMPPLPPIIRITFLNKIVCECANMLFRS